MGRTMTPLACPHVGPNAHPTQSNILRVLTASRARMDATRRSQHGPVAASVHGTDIAPRARATSRGVPLPWQGGVTHHQHQCWPAMHKVQYSI